MEIRFTIEGIPRGKQRVRVCRNKGRSIAYTPKQTIEYEQKVRALYRRLMSEKFPKEIALRVNISAFFAVPKRFNKEQRKKALNGEILPTKKPDSDNIIKIILDALNGVAYHDDAQVCEVYCEKRYGEESKTIVKIKEI